MALTLCYIPAEAAQNPAMWNRVRAWQKTSGLAWDKIRVTRDFLDAQQCHREDLKGALAMLRSGEIERVVYIEAQARAKTDLDGLAFACSCLDRGVPVEDEQGQPLLSAEQAQALQHLLGQAEKPHKAKKNSLPRTPR